MPEMSQQSEMTVTEQNKELPELEKSESMTATADKKYD